MKITDAGTITTVFAVEDTLSTQLRVQTKHPFTNRFHNLTYKKNRSMQTSSYMRLRFDACTANDHELGQKNRRISGSSIRSFVDSGCGISLSAGAA